MALTVARADLLPRTRIAELIDALTKMGARVIAFDIMFFEPDRLTPAIAADNFQGLDDATRDKLRALPSVTVAAVV